MSRAALLRITPDLVQPALVFITSMERLNSKLFDSYICYVPNDNPVFNDIEKICDYFGKESNIIKYDVKNVKGIIEKSGNPSFFDRYPTIIFSLFEAFRLLTKYEIVIAFDVDMIVVDQIYDLLKYDKGISFRKSRPLSHIFKHINNKDEFTPNAGLIVFTRNIDNYERYSDECYKLLRDNVDQMRGGYEEGTIRLLIDKFKINYEYLPLEYNCPIRNKQSSTAKIIHYQRVEKPWISDEIGGLIYNYISSKIKVNQILGHISKFPLTNQLNRLIDRLIYKHINDFIYCYIVKQGLSVDLFPELNIDWPFLHLKIKDRKSTVKLRYRTKEELPFNIDNLNLNDYKTKFIWSITLFLANNELETIDLLLNNGYKKEENRNVFIKNIIFDNVVNELNSLILILKDRTIKKLCDDDKFNKKPENKQQLRIRIGRNPKKIDIEDLCNCQDERITVNVDGVNFENYIFYGKTNRLYIFLSAIGKPDVEYPNFTRATWPIWLEDTSILIDDPTREVTKFAPGFFLGTPDNDYLTKLFKLICEYQKKFNILTKDVFIISSSNGGFAAIKLAKYFNGGIYCSKTECSELFDKIITTYKNYPKNTLFSGTGSIENCLDDGFITTNDSMLIAFDRGTCKSDRFLFTIDVNGVNKAPNALGHDFFVFEVDPETGAIIPSGGNNSKYTDETCRVNGPLFDNEGVGCTAKALLDNNYFNHLP